MAQKAKAVSEQEKVRNFQLRCSPAYRKWFAALSEQSRIPMSTIARDSLASWARERGYPAPPTS
jgi:hypothetical protein